MKGTLSVVATNGNYITPPGLMAIEIQSINLTSLGFVDEEGQSVNEIEICNGDAGKPIFYRDILASSYSWEINGSAILFSPRWEPGFEGNPNYELRNRTSPVDTMMPVNWESWRCLNNGSDGGYIIVNSINGCGGAHISDSVYYYWNEPLSAFVPEFINAPHHCVLALELLSKLAQYLAQANTSGAYPMAFWPTIL